MNAFIAEIDTREASFRVRFAKDSFERGGFEEIGRTPLGTDQVGHTSVRLGH